MVLYQETAEPAEPTPSLEEDVTADVAVVGGGITGLSSALHLAERNARVVVLEAETPGWGASGRNGGQVNPGLKPDPDVVETDFGPDLGARMNALAGRAPDFVFALIKRHAIRCEARQNGTLRAAVGAEHAAKLRRTTEQLQRRGAPVDFLEGTALERATGTRRYRSAMFDRRGGDLQPLSYTRGLLRAAIGAGAAVHGGSRVTRLMRSAGVWQLQTARGLVRAQQVLLATNGYTDDLWPSLRRSIVPLFSAIAATRALGPGEARAILPARPVLYESGAITVYYRVDAGGRLLMGGRGPMREIDSVAPLTHLLKYARRLWPILGGNVEWTHAWSGRIAMTRDHYPHVHEPAPGLTVCLGYNGRGVAMASIMGEQLAQHMVDPRAAFDMPITDARSIAMHSLWPAAAQAAILHGRIKDSLGI